MNDSPERLSDADLEDVAGGTGKGKPTMPKPNTKPTPGDPGSKPTGTKPPVDPVNTGQPGHGGDHIG